MVLLHSQFDGFSCKKDTASMLIMVLAQAQASCNRELIDVYVRPTTRFPRIRSNIKRFFFLKNQIVSFIEKVGRLPSQ